jgi:hypothetical protein
MVRGAVEAASVRVVSRRKQIENGSVFSVRQFRPAPNRMTFYGLPHVRAVRNGVRIPRRPPLERRGPTTGPSRTYAASPWSARLLEPTDGMPRRPHATVEQTCNCRERG